MSAVKTILRVLLGCLFIFAGVMHFVRADFFIPMMPEYLPFHAGLVYLSGIAEIAAGALIIVPKTQRIGAWAIIAILIAVFPANIHMAMHPAEFEDYGPASALYLRLPMQLIPLLWAFWYTRGSKVPVQSA